MKKNRIILLAVIIFLVLAFFVGQYISYIRAKDRARQIMLNHVYSNFMTISFNLDVFINNIENEVTNDKMNLLELTMLSNHFTRLDTILKQYSYYFPAERLYYGSIPNFDFISYMLTAGTSTANGMRYSGILADNVISESEVHYLKILRDDINLIVADMVSPENPPQENQNLTISQLNAILDNFLSKWSFHNENSPYLLLRYE